MDIDVNENGSGMVSVGVSLDRAASDVLGDLQIDLEDLALAGWEVSGPAREADNLLWIRAAKPFGSPEELPSILAEIAGPDVFRGFELRRRAEFAEQTWEVAGQIDPAAAVPELLDTLAFNAGLGEAVFNAVRARGGTALTDGLTMRVGIDLPGDLRSGGGDYAWAAVTGDEPVAVDVRMVSTEENTTAKTLRLVGLAAAALFILAVLLNLLGWWYVRRHRRKRTRVVLDQADSEQFPVVTTGAGAAMGAAGDEDGGEPAPTDIAVDWGPADTGGDFEFAQTAGEFVTSDTTGQVTDLDDDIDWVELSGADYEDLSGPDVTADDLAVPRAAASDDDWTASLEEEAPGTAEEDRQDGTEVDSPAGDEPGPVGGDSEPEETGLRPAGAPEAGDTLETDDETETGDEAEASDEAEAGDESEADDQPEPGDEAPATQAGVGDEPEESPDSPEPPKQEGDTVAERAAPPQPPAGDPTARALQLVVIGGWGVVFQPADPAGELVVPFVRQAGSTASIDDIRDAYRLATLGRLTTDRLWEACGLAGQPAWQHGPYTGRMTVSPGAADFIRSLLQRGIGVACVTNDVSDWSWRLRAWTGFEAVTPWVVSSDIGMCTPDPGVFEMLRRVSGVPFSNCLVIDSDHRTLDAARSLGMSTALFGTPVAGQQSPGTGHPGVGDFSELLRSA